MLSNTRHVPPGGPEIKPLLLFMLVVWTGKKFLKLWAGFAPLAVSLQSIIPVLRVV